MNPDLYTKAVSIMWLSHVFTSQQSSYVTQHHKLHIGVSGSYIVAGQFTDERVPDGKSLQT